MKAISGPSGRATGAASWDEAAASWPQGAPPLWRLQSDEVNRRLVARWLPAGLGPVLKTDLFDEFAAEGVYPELARRCSKVVGIDVSETVAAAAAERHPRLEANVADVRALPFADRSFDAVVSLSTLDHFSGGDQVEIALRELARVLRPQGRLVVTLDNPLNPLVGLRNRLPRRLARRLRHVPYDAGWTCGPRRLRGLLASACFRVERQTAILHAPRALVAAIGGRRDAAPGAIRALLAAEALGRLPTRYATGHFVAALAVRAGPVRHAGAIN